MKGGLYKLVVFINGRGGRGVYIPCPDREVGQEAGED